MRTSMQRQTEVQIECKISSNVSTSCKHKCCKVGFGTSPIYQQRSTHPDLTHIYPKSNAIEAPIKSLTGAARKSFLEKYRFRPSVSNCMPIVTEAVPISLFPRINRTEIKDKHQYQICPLRPILNYIGEFKMLTKKWKM